MDGTNIENQQTREMRMMKEVENKNEIYYGKEIELTV